MSELNIERISHVQVYTAMCEHAQECWDVLSLVKEKGIEHTHLNWHTPDEIPNVIEPMSDWDWFDGEDYYTKEITRMPFVTWSVLYDDVTIRQNVAVGLEELQQSQLWKNLNKVV